MVDAMVSDTSSHLEKMQTQRDQLEALIAEGKDDPDKIMVSVNHLSTAIKDYKTAASHVKKHIAKPKSKAKEPESTGAGAESPAARE